ncbi:PIN domain-like protein, partial [Clavulina sp. PMI_390]
MGVTGLWSLLAPVGRPVQLENMEGKKMAIDSSIWLYQFQATMRDKDGRALVNAHILGFLRRISKLLFYGIRPVFVFDGGAPALKKSTIGERKKKKEGAAQSYARTAEKILAAQMRREALNREERRQEAVRHTNEELLADAVYQEDIDSSYPRKQGSSSDKGKEKAKLSEVPVIGPSPSPKKNKWHDHDPYRLPDVNLAEVTSRAANATAPDPRLATEDELRQFIEEMVPEDFDLDSEAFRSLPIEAKYEIIGDLRLKSRQTSYHRLENMLASAPTALDFSKAQIVNLKQRNSLTQKLLATVETVGRAKYTIIPTRIASERNRQYVLVKNDGPEGGWVLGLRDEGTAAKPIDVDINESDEDVAKVMKSGTKPPNDSNDDSDDDDMEEILPATEAPIDDDFRQYRREVALQAIGNRDTDKHLAPLRTRFHNTSSRPKTLPIPKKKRISDPKPLFLDDDDDEDDLDDEVENMPGEDADEEDAALQLALRQSIMDDEAREAAELSDALAESTALHAEAEKEDLQTARQFHSSRASAYSGSTYVTLMSRVNGPAAKFAAIREAAMGEASGSGSNHHHSPLQPPKTPQRGSFGSSSKQQTFDTPGPSRKESYRPSISPRSSAMSPTISAHISPSPQSSRQPSSSFLPPASPHTPPRPRPSLPQHGSSEKRTSTTMPPPSSVINPTPTPPIASSSSPRQPRTPTPLAGHVVAQSTLPSNLTTTADVNPTVVTDSIPVISDDDEDMEEVIPISASLSQTTGTVNPAPVRDETNPVATPSTLRQDFSTVDLSSSPKPAAMPITPTQKSGVQLPEVAAHDEQDPGEKDATNEWDAAEELDIVAEENSFASFFSQLQSRSVDQLRTEIDAELKALQAQKKAAMRDSEDITQQMVGQIKLLLKLFGIPFVTAPMEAEAQCAALVSMGLVEGIITDDSDVFLFGGERVFRNMFNQSKTVECFLAADLSRELGLDRDTLVRLAFLLGSDYTEGLPGVGPVLAMELLKEFPGEDGLHRFRDWWKKVQTGKDTLDDNSSSFRKRLKKRLKDLHLTDDWPQAVVRDAYYHPTIDESDEPFKWGQPDLDALRQFLNAELGWAAQKVDDTLLPIIRKVGQRAKSGAKNAQSTMEAYFDATVGSGTYAPRKRAPYASKRLQKVVTDYRKQQKAGVAGSSSNAGESDSSTSTSSSSSEQEAEATNAKQKAPARKAPAKPRAKAKGKNTEEGEPSTSTSDAAPKPARKRKPTAAKAKGPTTKKRKVAAIPSESEAEEDAMSDVQNSAGASGVPDRPLEVKLRPRPKPR